MDKTDKIFTGLLAVLVTFILAGLIFIVWQFFEMLNDYRCTQLPPQEFFQDKACERYYKYRENER